MQHRRSGFLVAFERPTEEIDARSDSTGSDSRDLPVWVGLTHDRQLDEPDDRPPSDITEAWNQRRFRVAPTYDDQSWRRSAACRLLDQELFFPTGTSRLSALETQRAKLICASCSVRPACLQFALATNQEFGVWGGCDEDERRRLRRGTGGEPPIPPNA